MKFKYTILYVENVQQTIDFFIQAFDQRKAMIHESGDYGELDTGSTTLSFSSLALMNSLGKPAVKPTTDQATFEIAFETNDINTALHKALAAGATLVQNVEHMPWGQSTAYVTDKNGFLIEICTPVSEK